MNTEDLVKSNMSFSGVDMVATINIPVLKDEHNGINGNFKNNNYIIGSLQTLSYSIHQEKRPVRAIGNSNAKIYVLGPRTIAGTMVFTVFNKHIVYDMLDNLKQQVVCDRFLADQLPPFDINITFANEYGITSRLALYGVQLINEGQVMSINDIYTENTYQYVATDIDYMNDTTKIRSDEKGYLKKQNVTDVSEGIVLPPRKTLNIPKVYDYNLNNEDIEDTKITLSVSTNNAKDEFSNGLAELKLNPKQNSGTIIVEGSKLDSAIKIANDYNQNDYFVYLKPGAYSSYYQDDNSITKSNTVNFNIGYEKIKKKDLFSAPAINQINSNSVNLISFSPNIKKINIRKRGASDIESKNIDNNNAEIFINNLSPNTEYEFFGEEKDFIKSTPVATFVTKKVIDEDYNNLKIIVLNNLRNLKLNDASKYFAVIDRANKIAKSNDYTISIHDAINSYKTIVEKEIRNIENGYDKSLCEDIDICIELLLLHEKFINYKRNYINSISADLCPPKAPQLIDFIKHSFIVDKNIVSVDIYKSIRNTSILVKNVNYYELKSYDSKNNYFIFTGEYNTKYFMYAFDEYKNCSPKYEFYIMKEDNMIKYIDNYKKELEEASFMYNESNYTFKTYENSQKFNTEDYKNAVYQNAKRGTNIKLMPPIVYYDNTNIKVIVSNLEATNQTINVVLGKLNSIFLKEPICIKTVEMFGEVIFSKKEYPIFDDESYLVWFEDSDNNQISDPTSIKLNVLEDIVSNYFKTKDVDLFLKNLEKKLPNEFNLNEVLLSLYKDETMTIKDLVKDLINNTIKYKLKFLDYMNVIQKILEVYVDYYSTIDNKFYNKLLINKDNITLSSKEYSFIYIYSINVDNSLSITTMQTDYNKPIKIDFSNKKFIFIYGIKNSLDSVSGVIGINCKTLKDLYYKIGEVRYGYK